MPEIVKGLAKLTAKFRGMEKQINRRVMTPAVDAGAEPVLAAAQAYVPVHEGDLRGTLQIEADPKQELHTVASAVTAGSREVDYAMHIEFGTKHMSAQPFMRRAEDTAGPSVLRAMALTAKTKMGAVR